MMSGESQAALDAADRLFTDCNIVGVVSDLGGTFFAFPTWRLQVLLKFGMFAEVLEAGQPEPTGSELLDAYMAAMFFFARSLAEASTGRCIESLDDRDRFLALAANQTLRDVRLFMIHVSDLLDISSSILNARLCRLCDTSESFDHVCPWRF